MRHIRHDTPNALYTAPTAQNVGVVKSLDSLVWGTRACATGISCFHAKLPHVFPYISSFLTALLIPRAPRLQAVSSRGIVDMQAGQGSNQMGTKFLEMACDEHGIGDDGEYYGPARCSSTSIPV
jgi:hypothetical protein